MLYQDLDLPFDINDPDWQNITSLYNSGGLRYVRTLRIGDIQDNRAFLYVDSLYIDHTRSMRRDIGQPFGKLL